jgi:hypothetical protein
LGTGARGWTAAALTALLPSAAFAQAPAPLWRDVTRLGVVCLVNTDGGVDTGALHHRLCERVRTIAASGSPVPVALLETGDPSILAPDQVTLLVHASTTGGRGMAVTIRPYRNSGGPGLLFAAEPRVVPIGAPDALDSALTAQLDQTLPWRRDHRARRLSRSESQFLQKGSR